jgi:hypothetical protein
MARRRRSGGPLHRTRDGQYELLISTDECEVFLDLLNQFEALLTDPTNPAMRRLFPTAYVDDEERNAEYMKYMHEELLASKKAQIAAARAVLTAEDPLPEGELMGFMQTVNALRLVLGTLLDVNEGDDRAPSEDEPNAATWHLYAYLGWLLEWIVDELGSQL